MERGVEARDLRQIRYGVEQRADGREIVRLVQRRERIQALEVGKDVGIDADGRRIREAAVHDAMADGAQRMIAEVLADERDDMRERSIMSERGAVGPSPLAQSFAARIEGFEARRRIDLFDLPVVQPSEIAAALGEQRELDARRAGVDDGDRIAHGGPGPPMAAPQGARSKRRGYHASAQARGEHDNGGVQVAAVTGGSRTARSHRSMRR